MEDFCMSFNAVPIGVNLRWGSGTG
ncbi:unnamed protein product [Ectocarpus sp. CCAP 1310/34]|nr:unnamed protein product [Ectocarpus sp. CCAP 1310/34]